MKDERSNAPAEPAYLRLYARLRDGIVRGVYPLNTRMPSKRVTAEETGLSTVTVEHAYALLCDEGYVEARQRSGYFVVFRSEDAFALPGEGGRRAPPVRSHGETAEDFPFSVLARTMRGVISDYGPDILSLSPGGGCRELRQALCRYLAQSRGIETEPERIVVGAGAEYLYGLVVGLLGRERVYGIESPSYRMIEQVYRSLGVSYEKLPLGAQGIDSGALRSTGAQVLHITPYRSFPSGVTASASKRHEYLRWVAAPGRYLVEDDFESEFSLLRKPEDTLFSLVPTENVLYLNTFSRTLSPSLRIGYLLLPGPLLPVYRERYGDHAGTVSTYMQLVLARLIDSGDFERHINRVRRRKRREAEAGEKNIQE